jgi:hypothetical protein
LLIKDIPNLTTTRHYGDDPTGEPRTACCSDPVGCDRFGQGECWWFAANDQRQRTALTQRDEHSVLLALSDPVRRYLANDTQSEWAARARRSLKFCEMQMHLSAS